MLWKPEIKKKNQNCTLSSSFLGRMLCSNKCFFPGWWFDACGPSNLNGIYYQLGQNSNRFNGIKWYYWKGSGYSLKSTTMMIRPADFSVSLWTVALCSDRAGGGKKTTIKTEQLKVLKEAKALKWIIFYMPLKRPILCLFIVFTVCVLISINWGYFFCE